MDPQQESRNGSGSSPSANRNHELVCQSSMRNDSDNCSQQVSEQDGNEELKDITCIDDLEAMARTNLQQTVYDYYRGGADEEQTLKWNRNMISAKYCLKPRVMIDVSSVSLTKYVFGDRISFPVGISPTAMHKMAHPDGELATIRACKRANALMVLSLFSTTSLEDIGKEAPVCTKWQNIYIMKNRDLTRSVVNRAKRFGYRAIVVTCDAPIIGKRRNNDTVPLNKFCLANIEDSPNNMKILDHAESIFDPSVTWQDLAEIKNYVGDTMTVIAKGIMTPDDAEEAILAGVDGIFVSNHGGRQLDCMQSTIEVLPAIVKVINKRCPVFVDGGFRTGADILKALALGADMVFVGRPVLWGLASAGEDGVFKMLRLLEDELKRAMMFCGCTKLEDINESVVIERNLLNPI